MAVYTRIHLSGSTSGRPIPVAATATPGTTIHTAVGGSTSFDEIYIRASNVTNAAVTLTVEWGGVTDPGDHLVKLYSIPAYSAPVTIASGENLNGGLVVKAFCSVASAVNIVGFANRIS